MVISKKLSDGFSKSLVDNKLIQEEYAEAYSYCTELVLDILIFNGSLLLIACLIHEFINTLLFIISLVPLKMVAGGAHANSRIGCSLISYAVYFSVIVLGNILDIDPIVLLTVAAISSLGVVFLSPVEHINKQFSDSQKHKLKTLSLMLTIVILILYIIMTVFEKSKFCFTIAASLFIIFINQIAGVLINLRRKKDEF